jgi:acetyltransferase-like isoleucine patch superfamily enzyme
MRVAEMIFVSPKAQIKGHLEGDTTILGPTVIGEKSIVGKNVIVGYPARRSVRAFQFSESFSIRNYDLISKGAKIGRNCVVRSGTVIYELVSVGDEVETGHNVLIREGSVIDDKTLVGSSTQLDGKVEVGKNVNIAPNVCFTNDPYPTSKRLTGAVVEKNAIIGANSSVVAGITIGKNAVVGAGAIVTKNVPTDTVVVGAPARPYITRKEYDEKRLRWEKLG